MWTGVSAPSATDRTGVSAPSATITGDVSSQVGDVLEGCTVPAVDDLVPPCSPVHGVSPSVGTTTCGNVGAVPDASDPPLAAVRSPRCDPAILPSRKVRRMNSPPPPPHVAFRDRSPPPSMGFSPFMENVRAPAVSDHVDCGGLSSDPQLPERSSVGEGSSHSFVLPPDRGSDTLSIADSISVSSCEETRPAIPTLDEAELQRLFTVLPDVGEMDCLPVDDRCPFFYSALIKEFSTFAHAELGTPLAVCAPFSRVLPPCLVHAIHACKRPKIMAGNLAFLNKHMLLKDVYEPIDKRWLHRFKRRMSDLIELCKSRY